MQRADGKYGPVIDKSMLGVEWENVKACDMQGFETSLSHSEAETVIKFICAVKAVSFTQGAL